MGLQIFKKKSTVVEFPRSSHRAKPTRSAGVPYYEPWAIDTPRLSAESPISKTARRLPGTVAYLRVPLMLPVKSLAYRRVPSGTTRVPQKLRILDEGTRNDRVTRVPPRTSAYLRVPSHTFAYQHAILLMYPGFGKLLIKF